jgi:hypothetical protein
MAYYFGIVLGREYSSHSQSYIGFVGQKEIVFLLFVGHFEMLELEYLSIISSLCLNCQLMWWSPEWKEELRTGGNFGPFFLLFGVGKPGKMDGNYSVDVQ